MELTTDQKGSVAEAAIALAALELGVGVFRAISDGERYDVIFDVGGRLWRVQCKWAPRHGDVIVVRCYSCRRNREGLLRRPYSKGDFDAFAAYCPELRQCYFLPFDVVGRRVQIQLRLGPSRNNQSAGVNWADDFDFAATLRRLGAVAQLGERQRGTLEATGSSPVGSMTKAAQ